MSRKKVTIDGNEAAAYVAHQLSEVAIIYPITPSSPMGELADAWSAQNKPNIWGTIPQVVEMQSEGGAAGAVHGALQAGAMSSTFTASQGLLLMIPNMYKIAGELTPAVFHVAARSIAAQALSIFGDHSDVMATRQTGFAMLASNSVQEVMDLALVSHAATLESKIPFLHFFDGFRTSHEVAKIEQLSIDDIKALIDNDAVLEHRKRALTPDAPVLRGTAQNPDVYFQGRETVNSYYDKIPGIVQDKMNKLAELTGRQYNLFDYVGAEDAEKVIVLMGSGAEAVHQTVKYLNSKGEKTGVIKVRLYRPFSVKDFLDAFPKTTKSIAVLDRTKEPGSAGEPLYLDVVNAFFEANAAGELPVNQMPEIIGGRYGLSSKEFTPAMVKAVFDNLNSDKTKNHFTVGIQDDVTHTSLEYDPNFSIEGEDVFRGLFFGLGSDGTVSANKNSIKIIGTETENEAQGYFVYDSKKSGSMTTSHLRFGKNSIHSTYLIDKANFVACHQFSFLEKFNVLRHADNNSTFLLNSPYGKDEIWSHLPRPIQEQIINKKMKFYVIDGYEVAQKTGMGVRINTIMQTCFFAISGILPEKEAIEKIKESVRKTFGKRGEEVVQKNFEAIDTALAHLFQVDVPASADSNVNLKPPVPDHAPDFVKEITAQIMAGFGDDLPVSKIPDDGTYPTGTTKWEKRNISLQIPVWDESICIQCGKCSLVCPHGVIRAKTYDGDLLKDAPETFKSAKAKGAAKNSEKETLFTLQVAPEDCTGCALCVEACPAKNKEQVGLKAINMQEQAPLRDKEVENFNFFLDIPEVDRLEVKQHTVKGVQVLEPLFEFSGACAGCGETPYIKLVSQLFGDRMVVANATGCSSIYGGNLPTTPWTKNKDGRGPAWSNSLFEDNAEFGMGMRIAIDKKAEQASEMLVAHKGDLGEDLVDEILNANQSEEAGLFEQRKRIETLKEKIEQSSLPDKESFLSLADYLSKKSVWIIGGDGWAYDIGYGGLDHVLASGKNVNVLVLDTEVYSNTGGQMSKATPMGAIAKFAASGKPTAKKDLALQAMSYGSVYVARIAMGANDAHTVKAIIEAEKYDGPSLVIAYSHCIAHGYNLQHGLRQQKLAVDSGHWPLMRFNPELAEQGENPLSIDSKGPRIPLSDYIYNETRYKMLTKMSPRRARRFAEEAQKEVEHRWEQYIEMSKRDYSKNSVSD